MSAEMKAAVLHWMDGLIDTPCAESTAYARPAGLLRRNPREMVDGARPSRSAIARNVSPDWLGAVLPARRGVG